jgi:hypothetical protein
LIERFATPLFPAPFEDDCLFPREEVAAVVRGEV